MHVQMLYMYICTYNYVHLHVYMCITFVQMLYMYVQMLHVYMCITFVHVRIYMYSTQA